MGDFATGAEAHTLRLARHPDSSKFPKRERVHEAKAHGVGGVGG